MFVMSVFAVPRSFKKGSYVVAKFVYDFHPGTASGQVSCDKIDGGGGSRVAVELLCRHDVHFGVGAVVDCATVMRRLQCWYGFVWGYYCCSIGGDSGVYVAGGIDEGDSGEGGISEGDSGKLQQQHHFLTSTFRSDCHHGASRLRQPSVGNYEARLDLLPAILLSLSDQRFEVDIQGEVDTISDR